MGTEDRCQDSLDAVPTTKGTPAHPLGRAPRTPRKGSMKGCRADLVIVDEIQWWTAGRMDDAQ